MRALEAGAAATHLLWLSPCAASLVTLVRSSVDSVWDQLCLDPGGVLLVVRHALSLRAPTDPPSFPASLHDPAILEGALLLLDRPGIGQVDWNRPECARVYQGSLAYARLASRLADRTGRCDSMCAWAAGLLAPLGWQAMCSVSAEKVKECLTGLDVEQHAAESQDSAFAGTLATCRHKNAEQHAAEFQKRAWGLDQAGIVRRLCRRWQLPAWMTALIGQLELAPAHAVTLGAHPELFRVVQLAVALVQRHGLGLHLAVGASPEENAAALGLGPGDLETLERAIGSCRDIPAAAWEAPERVPLLRELVQLALENRRLSEAPALENLERDVDNLHRALKEQRLTEHERLRTLKLDSLAEFAAGAGHEINNPLAVISGQAQYLLTHEPDPSRQRSLQAVIAQAHRIHQILTELMQFARPPQPRKQKVDMLFLVRDVAASLRDLADQRRVEIVCPPAEAPVLLGADPEQIHTALTCLLRNAVEAAPEEGRALVRFETSLPDQVEVIVEDNGPGPRLEQREHLFDPFYSGREAGRGRGLGLPTAWKLARMHGGDVRFDGSAGGITRFVLTLPRSPELFPDPPLQPSGVRSSREPSAESQEPNKPTDVRLSALGSRLSTLDSQESGLRDQKSEVRSQVSRDAESSERSAGEVRHQDGSTPSESDNGQDLGIHGKMSETKTNGQASIGPV